jgi:hypothetical protein
LDSVSVYNPPSEGARQEHQRSRDNHQKGHDRNSESAPTNGKNKAARVGGQQWRGKDKQYESENSDEEAKGAKRNKFRNRLLSHGMFALRRQKAVERRPSAAARDHHSS